MKFWLVRFEGLTWRPMSLLASSSFAVYFIHPILLTFAGPLVHLADTGQPHLDRIAATALTMLFRFAAAWAVKNTLPQASRRISGW